MDETAVLQSVEEATIGSQADVLAQSHVSTHPLPSGRRGVVFSDSQRKILLKYFDEFGMTSTHRRNSELIERCSTEVGTTVERVKNWIGSEAVKRKRKAGILPRPKIEIAGSSPQLNMLTPPPPKKIKRVNGYNLFFSHCVRTCSDISTEFRERNAVVAQRWAELSEEERKEWGRKAELVCSSSVQAMSGAVQQSKPLPHLLCSTAFPPELNSGEAIIEKTLLSIQEKLDMLEQLGFEGYAILVNTGELQTHLLATSKGKMYHKMKQQSGKPLENPFIGYVFSEESDSPGASLGGLSVTVASPSPSKRLSGLMSALNSVETMQKSVMNAFALKYKVATGRSEVPYDNLQNLGVQVYGMPPGIPFHSPLLYNQQQLQQILANLEKITFLKLGPQLSQHSFHDSTAPLAEVEIATDSMASLVNPGELHIGAEEEATQ